MVSLIPVNMLNSRPTMHQKSRRAQTRMFGVTVYFYEVALQSYKAFTLASVGLSPAQTAVQHGIKLDQRSLGHDSLQVLLMAQRELGNNSPAHEA